MNEPVFQRIKESRSMQNATNMQQNQYESYLEKNTTYDDASKLRREMSQKFGVRVGMVDVDMGGIVS